MEVFTAPNYPTKATFVVMGFASAINNSGGVDILEGRVKVEFSTRTPSPINSARAVHTVTSGAYAHISPNYTFDADLAANEVVTMTMELNSVAGGWAANANNSSQLSYSARLAPVI